MFRFSPDVRLRLERAGWSEAYRYDTTEYVEALSRNGYPVHAAAVDFMHRFGGRRIPWELRFKMAAVPCELIIGVGFDFARLFKSNADWASEIVGTSLCYIGECDEGNIIQLLMDYTGTVYGDGNATIYILGNSGEEAIETMGTEFGENWMTIDDLEDSLNSFVEPISKRIYRGRANIKLIKRNIDVRSEERQPHSN